MATPRLSVIIPTYNRAPILARTVASLCAQSGELPALEIIVVDDGSSDDTPQVLADLQQRYGEVLIPIRQTNQKQGAARNNAMQRARGELWLFLGDDIIPAADFLAEHWQRFQADGRPEHYAAIGHTDWHPEVHRTPFLTWINDWGLQFGFELIDDPDHVPFNFFYTANLAFHRRLYERFGGFSASFRQYGWEDIELGHRYQAGGMQLRYIPTARAFHHHQITIRSFCRRQFWVGYSAVAFHGLNPELRGFLKYRPVPRWWGWSEPGLTLVARLLETADRRGRDLNRYTEYLMWAYYFLGMGHGQREMQSKS